MLDRVLEYPRATIAVSVALARAHRNSRCMRLGGEFMPPLDEGDVLYMPSALPGLSAGKASQVLQQTDRLIKTVPEVERVFGKMGRAETATDPAPLEMVETTIRFKPRDQWRKGMTPEKLIEELDARLQLPGLANIWVPPIRNRIDMLATGIKSPVGVKVAGTDPVVIDKIAQAGRTCRARRARRELRAGRASHGRALHRNRHRSRSRVALRPQHRRRAGRDQRGHRRRDRGRDRRRVCSAFRSACVIRASCAIR